MNMLVHVAVRRSSSVATHYLQNAYKGWEGVVPEQCLKVSSDKIHGEVPSGLKGTFLRNGPGLIEKFGHKLVHPIDGDGMVCALSFPGDGSVHFQNKFVETEERKQEQNEMKSLFRGQMGSITDEQKEYSVTAVQNAIATGKLPRIKFHNPSNTNVWHWGDRYISAYETSIPYSLDPSSLKTQGKETFQDSLKLRRLGAHFRIDSFDPDNLRLVTGAFARRPLEPNAALEINEYNWDMSLHRGKVFEVEGLAYYHDVAILEDYYVVHKSPYVTMNLKDAAKILAGEAGPDSMMKYNSKLPCQFIFLPKDGSGEPILIDTPFPFHMYHFGTCYQEGERVVLTTTALTEGFNMSWEWRYWLSNMCKAPGRFYRFDIDLRTGSIESSELDPASNEFPTSHPYRHGQVGTRYNYLMACDEPDRGLPFMDVVKVDAGAGASARKVWRADGLIGECVFAPRAGFSAVTELEEDDGWLITQYFNPDEPGKSQFLVLDARDVEAGPVCRINLDFKVNYPFHGTWTPAVFV